MSCRHLSAVGRTVTPLEVTVLFTIAIYQLSAELLRQRNSNMVEDTIQTGHVSAAAVLQFAAREAMEGRRLAEFGAHAFAGIAYPYGTDKFYNLPSLKFEPNFLTLFRPGSLIT